MSHGSLFHAACSVPLSVSVRMSSDDLDKYFQSILTANPQPIDRNPVYFCIIQGGSKETASHLSLFVRLCWPLQEHAWQNSWGLTTRTIGVMIMTHSDDKVRSQLTPNLSEPFPTCMQTACFPEAWGLHVSARAVACCIV